MVDSINFRTDRSGVSPVIGVILMVAVTVIIAAVIGSTALGLGNEINEQPPQAQWSIEQEPREFHNGAMKPEITISHNGGDDIDLEHVDVVVNGEKEIAYGYVNQGSSAYTGDEPGPNWYVPWDDRFDMPVDTSATDLSEKVSAGDSTSLYFKSSKVRDREGHSGVRNSRVHMEYPDRTEVEDGDDNAIHDRGTLDEYTFDEGDEIQIIWSVGDQSQTLEEYTVE